MGKKWRKMTPSLDSQVPMNIAPTTIINSKYHRYSVEESIQTTGNCEASLQQEL